MDRETYLRQKAFAGEKKPSMNRRCVGHDYTRRGVYMLTMVTEGRRPLFARVYGSSDDPRIELTELGRCVRDEWLGIPRYYPQVEIYGLQMMPDHLHGIIFIREQMECDLSRIVRGFKTGCGRHYRRLFTPVVATESQQTMADPQLLQAGAAALPPAQTTGGFLPPLQAGTAASPPLQAETAAPPPSVATLSQPRKSSSPTAGSHPAHGLLFAPGYNDRILKETGQLDHWKHYLRDNPRRLLMKREHPDLFRVQRGLTIGGHTFSAIGNRFLLQRPERLQVQCSRRLTEADIQQQVAHFLTAAQDGAVLVSPAISPGEKAVMRAAYEATLPVIILQENGFTDLAKPGGKRMEACAEGRMLILAPWEHHNDQTAITRNQCHQLNDMARTIATMPPTFDLLRP